MTSSQITRTRQALAETKKLLAKELTYSVDLQKKDMVEFYRNHIVKLENILSE